MNHIAIDIGGSLIKLVYFSPDRDEAARDGNGGGSEGSGSGYSPSSSPEPGGNGLLSQSARSLGQQTTQRGGGLRARVRMHVCVCVCGRGMKWGMGGAVCVAGGCAGDAVWAAMEGAVGV